MSPFAARIGTTINVVRLPGIPPTLCLSAIGPSPKLRLVPVWIIASV